MRANISSPGFFAPANPILADEVKSVSGVNWQSNQDLEAYDYLRKTGQVYQIKSTESNAFIDIVDKVTNENRVIVPFITNVFLV